MWRRIGCTKLHEFYLENHLQYITKWIVQMKITTLALSLKQTDCNIRISDLPFITMTLKCYKCFKNPVIASTLPAWWKTLNTIDSQLEPCMFSPI